MVYTAATGMHKQTADPFYRSGILDYKYLQNEKYPTMNSKNKNNCGVLHRWIIPCIISIGAGAVVYTIYSVRGR